MSVPTQYKYTPRLDFDKTPYDSVRNWAWAVATISMGGILSVFASLFAEWFSFYEGVWIFSISLVALLLANAIRIYDADRYEKRIINYSKQEVRFNNLTKVYGLSTSKIFLPNLEALVTAVEEQKSGQCTIQKLKFLTSLELYLTLVKEIEDILEDPVRDESKTLDAINQYIKTELRCQDVFVNRENGNLGVFVKGEFFIQ